METPCTTYSAGDFKNGQSVRWCPGCGDHAILNTLHKAMAQLGIPPYKTAVISGIGCSSRLPYYMNTYGFHTIHGRAAAIATGFKVANPEMTVWQVSGDGDGLAIGGNHFIHAIRRNVNINMLLFNNKIYGLTKGQYSPTSDRGFVSKSSPYGTTEDPFIPAELAFGARGNFFARSIDVELKISEEVLVAAAKHDGASVVEILQNCVIFNNGIHNAITDREYRADRTIHLVHGEKMIFGKEKNRGLVRDGFLLKAVTIGEDGYTMDDVLVHDAHTPSNFLHQQLAMMDGTDLPLAIGVIRDVASPVYNEDIDRQVEEVRAKKGFNSLREMILAGDHWTVTAPQSKD
ncbi:MAG: 2-oxoacid:ferredoxin oxidoreductase subunit beta [Bacteroidales bacterium]|nr:2-oxoacid:ferredoxin oxidoreductase subunit beta [Bacteroidales bacterium]MCD8394655.1 2-oxoacid:ferredoxin oxidoreductase subunit beta [Bacteroidales bacterium]